LSRDDGLTDTEGEVMDALCEAYNAYLELDEQHPADHHEFEAAIHRLQDLLAVRIARRSYPEGWAVFKDGVVV
jgi:hypothetical protein